MANDMQIQILARGRDKKKERGGNRREKAREEESFWPRG